MIYSNADTDADRAYKILYGCITGSTMLTVDIKMHDIHKCSEHAVGVSELIGYLID